MNFLRQNVFFDVGFKNQVRQIVFFDCFLSIEFDRLNRINASDSHCGKKQYKSDYQEGDHVKAKNYFPMPANGNKAHVIIMRIEFYEFEFILDEAKPQT